MDSARCVDSGRPERSKLALLEAAVGRGKLKGPLNGLAGRPIKPAPAAKEASGAAEPLFSALATGGGVGRSGHQLGRRA